MNPTETSRGLLKIRSDKLFFSCVRPGKGTCVLASLALFYSSAGLSVCWPVCRFIDLSSLTGSFGSVTHRWPLFIYTSWCSGRDKDKGGWMDNRVSWNKRTDTDGQTLAVDFFFFLYLGQIPRNRRKKIPDVRWVSNSEMITSARSLPFSSSHLPHFSS